MPPPPPLQAERLGPQFYPNNATFPVAFLALRLEQAAAGLWPAAAQRASPGDRPVRALLLGCRMSSPAVQRAYESLLARRAPGIEDEALLVTPALRAQLLRSLLALCQLAGGGEPGAAAAEGLGLAPVYSSQRRALAALADACDRWGARRGGLGWGRAAQWRSGAGAVASGDSSSN
jgi:hypothetical protein